MNDKRTREELKRHVERIENLEADRAEIAARIKAEYETAAGSGFDKRALKQLMKRRKADMTKSTELRAITDTYMRGLATFADTELGRWAAAWDAEQRAMENTAEPRETSYADAKSGDDRRPAIAGDAAVWVAALEAAEAKGARYVQVGQLVWPTTIVREVLEEMRLVPAWKPEVRATAEPQPEATPAPPEPSPAAEPMPTPGPTREEREKAAAKATADKYTRGVH